MCRLSWVSGSVERRPNQMYDGRLLQYGLSNGLCKNHTSPREPRMDLRLEYVDARTDKLKEICGPVLKDSRRLDDLNLSSFNCLYCGEHALSSLGPSLLIVVPFAGQKYRNVEE